MAEIRHTQTGLGKRVEIFVTAEELREALKQQDANAFDELALNHDEYCLTFKED